MVPPSIRERIRSILNDLYGPEVGSQLDLRLERTLLDQRQERLPEVDSARPGRSGGLSQADSILIAYADMVQEEGVPPLVSFSNFCREHLSGLVSGIHLLPFYPWSSDDGFSVIDYRQVDPGLGSWEHIRGLSREFRLMFDAVLNHVSAQSAWFKGFLQGDPRFSDYFIVPAEDWDLSRVIRPRTTPLLTSFRTASGEKRVWTTFSADQVDLNYRNSDLLLEIVEVLLFYRQQGAQLIRLDAIAFIWKESGTTCLHLPQAHKLVQLLRLVFEGVAPEMHIITETNVPQADNLAYFGDGTNEAHLVYNFPLPPLVLHTLLRGDCEALSRWASGAQPPSQETTFFNFLASHDGIGLNPLRGVLPEEEVQALVDRTLAHGGFVGLKANPDGSSSPYELNINYFDALNDPAADEPLEFQVSRFMCAQAIMLSFIGVPGIYFHSLFGSRGWSKGVLLKGYNRAVNREKLARHVLEAELGQAGSLRRRVFEKYALLLKARAACEAFDPYGSQQVLKGNPAVFGLLRRSRSGANPVVCFHNVSSKKQAGGLAQLADPVDLAGVSEIEDLLSGEVVPPAERMEFELGPYQVSWWRLRGRLGPQRESARGERQARMKGWL